MIATYLPPVLTPVSPEDAARAIRAALRKIVVNPLSEAVAVFHAHQALETWHYKSCWDFGVGNVKASSQYAGFFTCIKLNEVLNGHTIWFAPEGELAGKDGPLVAKPMAVPDGHPQTRMRAYKSLEAAEVDKLTRFLTEPRWRAALECALRGDAAGYVRAIKAQGYFTAAEGPYERSVVSLYAKYLPTAIATANDAPMAPPEPDSDELCRDIAACHRFELPPELAARVRVQQAEHVDFALDVVHADRDAEIAEEDEPTSPQTPEAKA